LDVVYRTRTTLAEWYDMVELYIISRAALDAPSTVTLPYGYFNILRNGSRTWLLINFVAMTLAQYYAKYLAKHRPIIEGVEPIALSSG
jgi:hypothetical protein